MKEQIVVTGYGCLTAVGTNFNETWNAIKKGNTGIGRITLWDTTGWEYYLGAQLKDYQEKEMLGDRKILKMISRQDVIGLNAVRQALDHSHLLSYRETLDDPEYFNNKTGVYVASPGGKFNQVYPFLPLFSHAQGSVVEFGAGLYDIVHPMWLLRILPNNVLAYTGIQYGFKGANQNIVNHGISGIQAITEAVYAIHAGIIDRAIVVGYEAALEPQYQLYSSSIGLLSQTHLLPFDENHNGTVLAEGAGCIILEKLSHAQERKAIIYGEILGSSVASEAMGVFYIKDNGEGLIRCIQKALVNTNLSFQSIGLITAHGNGIPNSDESEACALSGIFGATVPVTGFKWSLGHTIAAAGIIETILTLCALQEKCAPGIVTLNQLAKGCQGINVSHETQPIENPVGLVLNRGFGAMNAALVLTSKVKND